MLKMLCATAVLSICVFGLKMRVKTPVCHSFVHFFQKYSQKSSKFEISSLIAFENEQEPIVVVLQVRMMSLGDVECVLLKGRQQVLQLNTEMKRCL